MVPANLARSPAGATRSLSHATLAASILYAAVVVVVSGRPAEWLLLVRTNLLVLAMLALGTGAALLLVQSARRSLAGAEARPSELLREHLDAARGNRCLPIMASAVAAAALTLSSYNVFKQFVLPHTGYWLGRTVANADRALMGGQDAWRVTHALLPYAWQTAVLDLLYHGWFLPMGLGAVLCGFARPGCRLAERYLASYVLTWIVQGSLLAWLLPAAGPCFVRELKHADRFKPLTDLLVSQNAELVQHGGFGLVALQYQAGLIHLFRSEQVVLGAGIAAMPSLHNAMAALFACAAWHYGRALGALFTVYAVLIWIGSVHLGWHYALDGVLGAAVSVLTWHACGWWQRGAQPAESVPAIEPVAAPA
jgi:hypothetical protein